MTKLKDLCKIGECKTALDIGFAFNFYENDGNTENSGYRVIIYKNDGLYILIELNYQNEIVNGFDSDLFGDFCDMVSEYIK
ncbi:MAG: hypothetical protein ACRC7S_09485 [Cetobacterium sp.]